MPAFIRIGGTETLAGGSTLRFMVSVSIASTSSMRSSPQAKAEADRFEAEFLMPAPEIVAELETRDAPADGWS